MEPPSEQEIFDRVARHLLTQGRRSKAAFLRLPGRCAYRGDDDTSCAVGCLIPDERYRLDLEGLPTTHDRVLEAVFGERYNPRAAGWETTKSLLRELQQIHDFWPPEDWAYQLRRTAATQERRLDASVVDEVAGVADGS